MGEKRYAVLPGWVISQRDGQRHWINADELIRLYRVPRDECEIFLLKTRSERDGWITKPGQIVLRPRYDGNYSLPDAAPVSRESGKDA